MYDHIGLRVADLDAATRFYTAVLAPLGYVLCSSGDGYAGFGPKGEPALWLHLNKGRKADGAHIAGLAAGESLVELLEAESPDSPIGKFVAKRGPGIHHICFAVDDLDATLARCRAAGVRLIDETPRIGIRGSRVAFLHPAASGGVLTEIVEPAGH